MFDFYSKPTCDNVTPLKGILKSGAARDDHQKVVCFSGPAVTDRPDTSKQVTYPPGQQPHFNEDEDFCDRYKDAVCVLHFQSTIYLLYFIKVTQPTLCNMSVLKRATEVQCYVFKYIQCPSTRSFLSLHLCKSSYSLFSIVETKCFILRHILYYQHEFIFLSCFTGC